MRLVLASIVIAACSGHPSSPSPSNATKPNDATCAATAADLKAYLGTVYDRSAKPAPPWPTGDAETDKVVDEMRDKIRTAMKPADPGARATPLVEGIKPGRLDAELQPCPAATQQIKNIGSADDDAAKRTAFTGVADAIKTCDCKVNVPLVRALLYVLVRGPD